MLVPLLFCAPPVVLLQRTAVEEQIRHFGQTPMQLFRWIRLPLQLLCWTALLHHVLPA